MMKSRTPWAEKLRPDYEPKVVSDNRGRRMLVPTPMLVARELRRVPRGKLITARIIRDRLARRASADLTCPMTTGIFLNIIAGAAEDSLMDGKRPVAPYWRVVLDDGTLPPKFPIGRGVQAAHLKAEGHMVDGVTRVADGDTTMVRR